MGWNHRLIAKEYNNEVYFDIHEVYYDENGIPEGYTENPISVGGESIKSIRWTLNKMKECLKKPILCEKDKFPQEYTFNGTVLIKLREQPNKHTIRK